MKIIRTAQATTVAHFALVMGVFWGTWLSLSRTMNQLSVETFIAVGHQMIQNLAIPMAILLLLALLSALVTLVLLRRRARMGAPFWWLLAGFLLMVAALAITLVVEVPIDNQIQAWSGATVPGDWRSIQSHWELFHSIRTVLSITAVVAITISAVVKVRALPRSAILTEQNGRQPRWRAIMTDDTKNALPALVLGVFGLILAAVVTVVLLVNDMHEARDIVAVVGVFTGITGTLVGTFLGVHVGAAGKAKLQADRDRAVTRGEKAWSKLDDPQREQVRNEIQEEEE